MGRSRREPVVVLFVVADGPPGAASGAAFQALESRFESLRGRRFFGTLHRGEYRACTALRAEDDPAALGLPTWTIPGGDYAKRVWKGGWDGIAEAFAEMEAEHGRDPSRPALEYYRREDEVVLFLPVA